MADFDAERIQPSINEALEYDIRPFLNDALYYDFCQRFDNDADSMYTAYQKLLNGGSEVINGQTVFTPSLAKCASYFVLARLVRTHPIHYSRFAIVRKINNESEAVSPAEIKAEVDNLLSNAGAEQNRLCAFLDRNKTTYPLWNFTGGSRTVRTTGLNTIRL